MSGPIIVTATLADADLAWFDALRRAHFPPERNQLTAHVTLFHHLPPSIEAELIGRLLAEAQDAPPDAWTAGLMDLGGGTAIRIRSPGLEAIRARLADAFAGLLIPQDAAGWRPHVTIQNKVPRAAAQALQTTLEDGIDRRPVCFVGLASWHYLGGPWAPLRAVRFSRSGRSRRS